LNRKFLYPRKKERPTKADLVKFVQKLLGLSGLEIPLKPLSAKASAT
jgi:hypothetical protein